MSTLQNVVIGFDGKRAAQNRTGLGNYSRFVISGLSRYSDVGCLNVYAPSERRANCLDCLDKEDRVEMIYPTGKWGGKLSSLWRIMGVTGTLASDGVSLFHGLSGELPLNIKKAEGVKSIVTIHDLIFRRYPECYALVDRMIYDYKSRKACEQSDRIVAVSQCTKRDIVEMYGIVPEKVEVVYQGCDKQFWQKATDDAKEEARKLLGLPEHYVLYVGSIERRKNLMLLAKAMTRLPKEVVAIAVGKRTGYAYEIDRFCAANGLAGRLRMMSGVPFCHFPSLYQMADVMVYPSRFEGFGIPLLEALVSGVPAIGCTGSCLEEAGGPDSLYVNPDDDEGLATAIDKVLSSAELRDKMIRGGMVYAQNFSQDALTRKLVDVYQRVLAQ